MVNEKGMEQKPVAGSHPVGEQGKGGPVGSQNVEYVHNPNGIAPKKIGEGMGPLTQGPIQPKVGR